MHQKEKTRDFSTELRRTRCFRSVRTVMPSDVNIHASTERLLSEALEHPLDGKCLQDEKTERAAIIFSDATRYCSPFIEQLVRKIEKKSRDIRIISSHGAHAPSDSDFFKKVLGEKLYASYKNDIIISSPQNASSAYEYIGDTDRGTRVELNKELLDRDLVVSSLNIQPHYFAGYEGGAKSLLPGCASLRTIVENHSLVIGDPNARELRIKGNRVREDMNQSSGLLSKLGVKHRILDFVLDREGNMVNIGYGDPILGHQQIAETFARQLCTVVTAPADVIVTVAGGPGCATLYQALKAVAFASNMAIERHGKKSAIILYAPLTKGIGGEALKNEMERYGNMEAREILLDLRQRTKEGKISEASQKLNRLALDDSKMNLHIVSPEAPKEVESLLSKTKYQFSRQISDAIKNLDLPMKGDAAVIPYGSFTVPVV